MLIVWEKKKRRNAVRKTTLKNKSVLDMEFAKWQIKIKKHDLGQIIF